ncbi:hypothetical protein MBUL_01266 [Methylobacterium bullatum]|uniref:Uncharacterized protein n=1 Tax=Methylobacterium bullatum TaxID=570505 RepID=A0A679IZ93_9HYPH|nr:hypothetical protein MBUL_01266 [Methylobacterium bullatum]
MVSLGLRMMVSAAFANGVPLATGHVAAVWRGI